MNITTCKGDDPSLFHWIGNLVLNKSVLKYNNNFPFKTDGLYTWFIAHDDTRVLGFMPVDQRKSRYVINNYYLANDDAEVLVTLLKHVMDTYQDISVPLDAVAHKRHAEFFKKRGFQPVVVWSKYVRLVHAPRKKEE